MLIIARHKLVKPDCIHLNQINKYFLLQVTVCCCCKDSLKKILTMPFDNCFSLAGEMTVSISTTVPYCTKYNWPGAIKCFKRRLKA